ncbi:MAG: GAF domain-containing protein [Alphaproteobacteria bacterium]
MRAIDRARPTIREVGVGVNDEDMRRLRQAEVLLNISRKVAGLESLEEVLATLVEMTTWEVGAERGSLFLNDPETNELYSRIALGNHHREIRILNTSGIAGHVYNANEGTIIHDAYADPRFDRSIDDQTGFITRSILCAPVRTVRGEVIGVIQALNKQEGRFTQDDLDLLEAMSSQAAVALQSTQFVERMKKSREQELEFLDLVADVTSDIDLRSLLKRVMGEAARMLNADRSTLFLNDEKTSQLWSEVGAGLETTQIRFPNHLGIAGAVFTSGQSVNIPYAYADLRFNPAFDKQTGYFTRSILCVPVVNKDGKCIGVTQVLNKRGGPFSDEDESRLKAFTAQVSIALENAKLFADVQNMKNYNESMLQSMSNGVITIDEDGKIVTCNASGLRILRVRANDIVGRPAAEYFAGPNAWVMDKVHRVVDTQESDISVDAELEVVGAKVSTNLTALPLITAEGKKLGSMLMIEDISTEKRMKSTMARYMDPGIADQLLAGGEEVLGGKSLVGTVLFSDIRAFTTLTEELGPQGTVSLLNEYFTIMVDALQREDGMLDKFIGDAIMAVFGIPIARPDDEDRAVRAAIAMISDLFTWNKQRADQGKRQIDMGIGLNTDTVVSGNIGSPKRMDYTIIGDGVNLAARLESACKQYGARILISENTFDKLRGTYRARQVDKVIVKGKTEPVGVFEILDYHTADSYPNLGEALGRFRDAVEAYQNQRWDDAIDSFESVLGINPGDKCAQMYVQRCLHFRADPPPAG